MKIRTDFVTNSSSSTFYINKKATLIFVASGEKYSFSLNKENSKTVDTSGPKDFSKFVNWRYLLTGSKPTISKVLSGKGMKDYVQYLIDNKKETGEYYIILDETEYTIGYGESIGNDFINCQDLIFSHLHPTLAQYYTDKHLFAEINGSGKIEKWSFWIEQHRITGDPEGDQYYYLIDSHNGDCTDEFYWILHENAGSPKLDFGLIEKTLARGGINAETIQKMKEKDLQIIYFANKTKKNDVIAYFTEAAGLTVQPIGCFLKDFK
jgi:hypothetical protein